MTHTWDKKLQLYLNTLARQVVVNSKRIAKVMWQFQMGSYERVRRVIALNLPSAAGEQNKSRKKTPKVNEMSPVSSSFDCCSIYSGESWACNQSCSETKSAIMDSFGPLWRIKSFLVSCEWSAACEFYITLRLEHLRYIFCISIRILAQRSHQLYLNSRHARCLGKWRMPRMSFG